MKQRFARGAARVLAMVCAAAAGTGAAACTDTVSGVVPVGGDEPSAAELERFARRLHLDLTGLTPPEEFVTGARSRLESDGNTAGVRGALVDELLVSEDWARSFWAELENGAFGGETIDDQYDFVCGIIRGNNAACVSCPPPVDGDPCAGCSCEPLVYYVADRDQVTAAIDDFLAGDATTGALERAVATAVIYRATFGDAATLATALFEQFLGRPAEPEEARNAGAMIIGALLGPEWPAGLLFHRHGSSYADLVDIVFQSEVYREAVVTRTFGRYLGRPPSAAELRHFVNQLDEDDPDVRDVVRAVASSREYFEQ